jgi:SRSO17 transposase
MGSRLSEPGPREKRFAAYREGLANAAGHADRHTPLKNYCAGLLLPGERKSVEPMAARLAPNDVRRMHQSLHHLVSAAPWNDEEMLEQVRQLVLPAMQKQGPVVAWIIDDTGSPKQGKHSVGVARQYCGPIGKQDNCQAAVSLSVSTWNSSLPVAWRLYLPECGVRMPNVAGRQGCVGYSLPHPVCLKVSIYSCCPGVSGLMNPANARSKAFL